MSENEYDDVEVEAEEEEWPDGEVTVKNTEYVPFDLAEEA